MQKLRILFLMICFFPGVFAGNVLAQKVVVLKLFDEIHPGSARYIAKGFDKAQEEKADLILVHMNTYGGMVQYADSIRTELLDSKIPTAVYIDKNAASAGALISIACDSIFMAPGSSIGAATVVSGETGEAMPDKYQSYFRGIMRATAEKNGRNPKIAEKMVDQNLELDISPKGTVITFTPSEAEKHGYSDGMRTSVDDVLKGYGMDNPTIITHENDFTEQVIQFLINPGVSGFLITLIFGGLFFELKTPGLGFPGAVAAVAATLFFAPHYLEGLAASWEIVLFFVGIALIAMEIFVVPGFGVTGIGGIIATISALAIALVRNVEFDFGYVNTGDILQSFTIVMVAMATSIILVLWGAKYVSSGEANLPFVDRETQDKEKGYTALNKEFDSYVGQFGKALTDLKPSGFIEIDGKRLDAETQGDFIAAKSKIKVLMVRSTNLIVVKV